MPDLWMDVDAALSEVPVNIAPLVDDTDGKTIETCTYNQAGSRSTGTSSRRRRVLSYRCYSHRHGRQLRLGEPGPGHVHHRNPGQRRGVDQQRYRGLRVVQRSRNRNPAVARPGYRLPSGRLNNLLIDNAYSATRGLAGTALPAAAADAAGGLPISDAGGWTWTPSRPSLTPLQSPSWR